MATSSVVVGSPPYLRWRPIVRPEDLQAPGTVIQSHFSGAAADLRRLVVVNRRVWRGEAEIGRMLAGTPTG